MSIDKTETKTLSAEEQWLNSAIESKLHLMRFAENSPNSETNLKLSGLKNPEAVEDNPESTINLSRFGLKNQNDLRVFLLSPAGETVKTEIGERVALEEAKKEELEFEQRELEKRHSLLKSLLMLWLIEEKGHAAQQLRELIDEQNTKAIEQSKQAATPQERQSTAEKSNKELQEAMANYNNALQEHENKRSDLEAKNTKLTEQLHNLTKQEASLDKKHAVYDASMEEFDKASDNYEKLELEDLDKEIEKLSQRHDELAERVFQTLDSTEPNNEEKARELMNQQNAINLQIGALKDLRDVKSGSKSFYDAEGHPVSSQKDAQFILKKDQQVIKQDGVYYLVKSGTKLSDLTDTQKAEAAEAFKKAEPTILSVKKVVAHTAKQEKQFNSTRISETREQLAANNTERREVDNQIKLLQSVKANMSQPQDSMTDPMQKPVPSISNSKGVAIDLPPPSPSVISFTQKVMPFFKSNPPPSQKELMDKIDNTNKKSPENAKEIKNFFTKALKMLGLGTIPSMAPLPQTTMDSLLKHMERFGADSYQVGNLKSPLDTAVKPQDTIQLSKKLDKVGSMSKNEPVVEKKKAQTPSPLSTAPK